MDDHHHDHGRRDQHRRGDQHAHDSLGAPGSLPPRHRATEDPGDRTPRDRRRRRRSVGAVDALDEGLVEWGVIDRVVGELAIEPLTELVGVAEVVGIARARGRARVVAHRVGSQVGIK